MSLDARGFHKRDRPIEPISVNTVRNAVGARAMAERLGEPGAQRHVGARPRVTIT